jgi:hypothetical protein
LEASPVAAEIPAKPAPITIAFLSIIIFVLIFPLNEMQL